ncbi:MAG: hypothetical protein KDA50_08755, partial [Rhodobacteraceae bacterium]|nr:hypothetical protein [Paracoccaceae bacterium]
KTLADVRAGIAACRISFTSVFGAGMNVARHFRGLTPRPTGTLIPELPGTTIEERSGAGSEM